MKIIHWNVSKKSHPFFALKKYEDELFRHLVQIRKDWNFQRCYRKENVFLGNSVAAWPQYKTDHADLVHATSQTVAPAVFFHAPKTYVVTVHDLAPLIYPSEKNDLSMKIQWSLTPQALKKADQIIAISEFTKSELIRLLNIDPKKITVIYQGVDHEVYKPIERNECKKVLGLHENDKHILVVSSNLEHKRMDLAKKIFSRVSAHRKDIRLMKAGYSEILSGENIINLGWIPEEKMPILYNAADIFLHTSEYEGFGLPVLEAMSCGTMVVANNRASIPEIMGDTGKILRMGADQPGIDKIAETILETIDTEPDNSLLLQSRKFSWEKTAAQTLGLYASVLDYS
jgi:glycosyltransferase involved in cell wall biosynthesis